jgi:ABC-type branched-subunit amino acid transport system substrate-binding protein
MRGFKSAATLLTVAGLASSVVACGGSDDAASTSAKGAKEPVKVLAVFDMTGATKYLGEADKAGLDAAVNYLNANGGIDGRKVELKVISDNGDPTTSVTVLTKELASGDKPTFVVPGSFSSIAHALQPVLTRNKVLGWGFGNFSPCSAENCGTFFQLNGPTSVSMTQAVEYFKEQGYKKLGVILDQRDTSVAEIEELKKQLPAAGIDAEYVTVPAKALNYVPQLNKIKSAGVDAVFGAVIGQESGYLLDARQKLGWKVPVVLDVSASSTGLTAVSEESQWKDDVAMQTYAVNDPQHADTYPGFQLMLDNNEAAKTPKGFGGQVANVAAYTWDAMMLLNTVISATHSLDPTVNQQWLEKQSGGVGDPKVKALMATHKYSTADHTNQGWSPSDFAILPVAPVDSSGQFTDTGH